MPSIWRWIVLVILTVGQVGYSSAQEVPDEPAARTNVSSDLLAAFLVSYNDYAKIAGSRNERDQMPQLQTAFSAVTFSRFKDSIEVFFDGKGRGGSMTYVVDAKTFAIRTREFAR